MTQQKKILNKVEKLNKTCEFPGTKCKKKATAICKCKFLCHEHFKSCRSRKSKPAGRPSTHEFR